MSHERIALLDPKHKLIINVIVLSTGVAVYRLRQFHFPILCEPALFEQSLVSSGILLPSFGPPIEIIELYVQNRGLNRIKTEVPSNPLVIILRLASVNSQDPYALCKVSIAGRNHPTIA